MFPNPTGNSITVQSAKELGVINIYNTIGEIVYTRITNENQQQIDLSKQGAGIYIVSVQNKHLRVVKQ